VATGDLNERRVRVFDRDTGRLIRTLEPPVESIQRLQFGRSRQLLIQGGVARRGTGGGNIIAFWHVGAGRGVRRFKRLAGTRGLLTPDGRQLILKEEQVRVLDAASGRQRRIIPVQKGARVDIAADGRVLACLEDLRRLTLWELATAQERWQVELPQSA